MRWKVKRKPMSGAERVKRFFAFIPVKCQKEYRWFEMVTIVQQYIGNKWVDSKFKDG